MEKELPAGWRIDEDWVPEAYEIERYYFVKQWSTRQVRKHWWSKKKPVTDWYSVHRERRKEAALSWALDTIKAMEAK